MACTHAGMHTWAGNVQTFLEVRRLIRFNRTQPNRTSQTQPIRHNHIEQQNRLSTHPPLVREGEDDELAAGRGQLGHRLQVPSAFGVVEPARATRAWSIVGRDRHWALDTRGV
jgi:hypothetical protein